MAFVEVHSMGFTLVQKHMNNSRNPDTMTIRTTQSQLPRHVVDSVGNLVTIMIDRFTHRIAIRSADDDDANGYMVNRYGVLACNAVVREARDAGLTIPATVPIAYDAELDAWVADLMISE